jgi:hypothetical protein
MKRIRSIATAQLAAAALFAAAELGALPIDNRVNPDGTPVLIPAVQQYQARKGTLTLPEEFTFTAPAAADNEADVLAELVKRYCPKVAVHRVEKDAFCRLELTDNGVPESDEGYTLEIDDHGVVIRSRDVRGLYYGVRTFENLLRNALKPELPQCRIVDWPKLKIRGLYLNLRHQGFDGCMPEILSEIDAVGALKYNHMMLEFGEKFPYKNNPFTNRENGYSLADVESIKAAAKRHHIEIIPLLQIITHDEWLHSHPRYKEEIAEDPNRTGWSTSACHMSELGREVQLMAIREQIEFFKPKYFNISMDELDNQPYGICLRCKKYGVNKLWRDATLFYTGEVLKLGVTPILYHDMFYPGKIGGGVELLPELDKRIIFCNWDYGLELRKSRFPFFKQAGFQLFSMTYCLRMDNMRVMPLEMLNQGCDGVFLAFWGEFRYPSKAGLVSGIGLAGYTLGGCYEWNPDMPHHAALTFDPAWETLRLIMPDRAVEAPTDVCFAPLPLDKAFNAKLGRDRRFPTSDNKVVALMRTEADRIPEKFHIAASPDGGYFAILAPGGEANGKVVIPVDAKAEWLGINAFAGALPYVIWGRPNAAFMDVCYEDGTKTIIVLEFRNNLPFWNCEGGGYGVRCFTRFNDTRGAYAGMFAQNWKNPHPDKVIREIVFRANKESFVPVALLSLSLGNSTFATTPDDSVAPARVKDWSESEQVEPISEKTAGSLVISDYSGGKIHNAYISLSGIPDTVKQGSGVDHGESKPENCFVGKFSYEIAEDPAAPERGKVLKLSIPALKQEYSYLRPRLVIDIKFDRSKIDEIGSMFLDYRVTHPWFNEWPAVYLMSTDPFGAVLVSGYHEGRRDRQWHHVVFPYRTFKEERKLDPKKADTVRLSFFMRELNEPSEVYIGMVGLSPRDTQTNIPLRCEKVPVKPGDAPGELFFIE